MGTDLYRTDPDALSYAKRALSFLDSSQIAMIDEALNKLGEFGEVRLIVQKGRLRFVITQQSFDALKWTTREPALERSE